MSSEQITRSLDYYAVLGHSGAMYYVGATASEALPPITLSIGGRGFSLQDYLTPDEADRLADALEHAAAAARSRALGAVA